MMREDSQSNRPVSTTELAATQPLVERLRDARRQVMWRQWLAALFVLLIAFAGIGLIAAFLNRLNSWQESSALLVMFGLGAAFIGLLGALSWKLFLRPTPLPTVAGRIEKRQPEWMDSLICTVEQELQPENERRSLERSLIAETRARAAGLDFSALLQPWYGETKLLAGGAVLAVILLPFFLLSDFSKKAYFQFGDLVSGESSGLTVEPGTREVPRGLDLRINAEVFRWESAAQIEYVDNSGHRVYPMHAREDGHAFTFYHIEDDIRYRVITPSLRSEWYELTAYTPPSIDDYELHVTPPAYTRLPEETYSELSDIEVIEGSAATVALGLPEGVQAALRLIDANEDRPLTAENGEHSLEMSFERTDTVRFILHDAEGREARTPEMEWKVRPDAPPSVEITRPARDMTASPAAAIGLSALVADDFGITEINLHYSVSGERREQRRVFRPSTEEPVTERTVRTELALDDLEVEEGDVVTYFFTAKDNREPDAQVGRSEVYFLEIQEESEPEEEMEGTPEELDDFDVQALIVETKRLIRRSWAGVSAPESARERIANEVADDLDVLQTEVTSLQRDVVAQLGEETAEPVVALLERVNSRFEFAERLVRQELLEDSIPLQEMALADLVALQNALMDDRPASQEPSEDGDGGTPPPQEQPEDGQENLAEVLEELLQDTRRLADDQAAQNTRARRLAERDASEEQRDDLRSEQEALAREAERIRDTLSELQQAQRAQGDLAAAGQMMDQASERIGEGELGRAERAGERARSQLLAAMEGLEESVSQATSNQITQLAAQAQQLASAQAQAAEDARSMGQEDDVSAEEAAAARDQQRELQRQLSEILSEVDGASQELRESNPEASGELADIGRQIRDDDVEGEMGRAGNALLYRRFERASELQDDAAGRLGEFAEQLNQAADRLPSLTREQLQQLLSSINRSEREVMDMAGQSPEQVAEQLAEMQERLGRQLERAGRSAPDSPLQEIGGELMASAQADSDRPNIFRAQSMLQAAGRAVEEQIFAMEVDRRARLQRQASDPPEKYRNLVEEYFRSLSDE